MRNQIIKGALVQAALFMFLSLQAQQPEAEILFDIGIRVQDMQFTPAGELVICGSSSDKPALMKADTNGNILWAKSYNDGKMAERGVRQNTEFHSVVTDASGNIYTLCTHTGFAPNFVVKFDPQGEVIWESEYLEQIDSSAYREFADLLFIHDTTLFVIGRNYRKLHMNANTGKVLSQGVFGSGGVFNKFNNERIYQNGRWWFWTNEGVGSIDTTGRDSIIIWPDLDDDEFNIFDVVLVSSNDDLIHSLLYKRKRWSSATHLSFIPSFYSFNDSEVVRDQNLFEFTEEVERDTMSYHIRLAYSETKGYVGMGIERRGRNASSKSELFLYQGRLHDEFERLHYSFPDVLNQPQFGYRAPSKIREFNGSFYCLVVMGWSSSKIVKMKFPNLDEYPPVSVAEKQKTANHNLRIYPNPSTGTFELTAEERIERIQVFSLSGALIKEYRPADIQQQITIENPGTYLIKTLLESGKIEPGKVVKL